MMVASGGAPRASIQSCLPAAGLIAAALSALIMPRGLVVVLALVSVLGLLAGRVRPGFDAALRSPPLVPIGLLMLWGAVAIWWSVDPVEAIRTWLGLLWVGLGALVVLALAHGLATPVRTRIGHGTAVAGAAIFGILVVEVITDGIIMRGARTAIYGDAYPADWSFLRHYLRTTAVLAVFVWPSALVIWRHFGPAPAVLMVAVSSALAAFIGMNAAFLASLAGAVVFAATLRFPRQSAAALSIVTAAAVLLAPLIAMLIADSGLAPLPSSWMHRLAIWDFVAQRIAESPWIGWGFDASKHLPGGAETIVVRGIETLTLPSHPHNGSLQVWAELGAPGALLLAAVFARLAWTLRAPELSRIDAAARAASMAAFFVIFSLSYGAWQNWWMACAALIAALFVALSPPVARA